MADEVRKISNYVGPKRTDLKKYVSDLDRDVANLFDEKSFNLQEAKRYAYMVAVTQG